MVNCVIYSEADKKKQSSEETSESERMYLLIGILVCYLSDSLKVECIYSLMKAILAYFVISLYLC